MFKAIITKLRCRSCKTTHIIEANSKYQKMDDGVQAGGGEIPHIINAYKTQMLAKLLIQEEDG